MTTREQFRLAMRDPATRIRVGKNINADIDSDIVLKDGSIIRVTVLGAHGYVKYKK
jgi:hypothetical protein